MSYQGHTTDKGYIRAWTEHIGQLRWMWSETMKWEDVEQRHAALVADIEAAAAELVKLGKLEREQDND